ncbi:MAG: hypothetical protein O8C63_02215 [Candidatus Methanoperedens sp.]|nr:hypothetical protein [Candidatus Methanoperedens sp.]
MDCCGSSKPKEAEKNLKAGDEGSENNPTGKETDKDVKAGHMGHESSPAEKEQTRGGGCCGGGGSGMWLHLIIMFIVFIAIWYFSKR